MARERQLAADHRLLKKPTIGPTNGLLRQYFRQRSDFGGITQEQLDAVAARLNGRPRKTLGWLTPAERFAQLTRAAPATA